MRMRRVRRVSDGVLIALLALSCVFDTAAQTVVVPSAGPSEKGLATPTLENLLQWGPVTLHPHVSYRVTYGTDVPTGSGDRRDTFIHTLSPGMLFTLKDHWTLDYTPSLAFYSDTNFADTVNHALNLTGQARYANWGFALLHRTAITSEPLVETAAQTDQQTHDTSLNADYPLNSKASLTFGLDQNLRFVSGTEQNVAFASDLNSSRQWSGTMGINYQFWSRLRGGVSLGAGYVDVDLGSDMTFEQLNGTLAWLTTDKLSFSLNAGGEVRQFLETAARALINPVFGAAVRYQPVEATTLSLTASRAVNASYFRSEIVESTGISASLQQRLLKNFYLGLSGGYRTASYKSTEIGTATTRTDDGFNFGTSLSCTFLKRGSFSVFYNYNENSSSAGNFSFASRQIGCELGYRY